MGNQVPRIYRLIKANKIRLFDQTADISAASSMFSCGKIYTRDYTDFSRFNTFI